MRNRRIPVSYTHLATGEGLGLIGSLAGGTVKGVHIGPNCLFDGEGGNFVGGITGRTHNGYGTIINCISEACLLYTSRCV